MAIFFAYDQYRYHRIDDTNPSTSITWANTQISVLSNAIIGQDKQINLGEYLIANNRLLNYENSQIDTINVDMEIGEYDPVIYFSTNTIFGVWQTQIGDLANTALIMDHPYPNGRWEYVFPALYGEIEKTYANTVINIYANTEVGDLYTEQIELYTAETSIRGYANVLISLYAETQLSKHYDIDSIAGYANTVIWPYEEQTIGHSYYQTDRAIASTSVVSDTFMGYVFDIESLENTVTLSDDLETLLEIGGHTLISIEPQTSIGTITTELFLTNIPSIDSQESFEEDLEALLFIGGATLISVESGLDIGSLQVNRSFTTETFIEQEQTFGTDVLVLYIGADGTNLVSVAPTSTFGTPVCSTSIHRVLVFKNDNITKIGQNESVEIAGGIIMNPTQYNSTTATEGSYEVPSTAAGFILVTIDGTNYKMPFYNE